MAENQVLTGLWLESWPFGGAPPTGCATAAPINRAEQCIQTLLGVLPAHTTPLKGWDEGW
jgi:hypothetical protein